jgi:hypothetical protein
MTPDIPWHSISMPFYDCRPDDGQSQLITKGALYDVTYRQHGEERQLYGIYRRAVSAPEEKRFGYLIFTEVIQETDALRCGVDIRVPADGMVAITKIAEPGNERQERAELEALVR